MFLEVFHVTFLPIEKIVPKVFQVARHVKPDAMLGEVCHRQTST
jgi:hypothetical protein